MSELTPIDKLEGKVFFFVRFGERKYLEDLKKGQLYMHNTSFHHDLEETKNVKGQGDKYDSKLVLSDIKFEMRDPDTDALLYTGTASRATLFNNKNPIFCLFAITNENIVRREINEEEKKMLISYAFTPEQKKYIKESYKNADSAMIIGNPAKFINQIRAYADGHSIEMVYKPVRYSNYNINEKERIQDCAVNFENIYFWKDNYFKLEQEHRVLFPTLDIDDYVIFDIGTVEDSNIIDIDTFFGLGINIVFDIVEVEEEN